MQLPNMSKDSFFPFSCGQCNRTVIQESNIHETVSFMKLGSFWGQHMCHLQKLPTSCLQNAFCKASSVTADLHIIQKSITITTSKSELRIRKINCFFLTAPSDEITGLAPFKMNNVSCIWPKRFFS